MEGMLTRLKINTINNTQDEGDDPEAKERRAEIARQEKERLRKQTEAKKELLAKMRQEQDAGGGAAADVSVREKM